MSIIRFFIAPQNIVGSQAVLDETESRHALQVMRLQPGDEVVLFDGQGRAYEACLDSVKGKRLVASIIMAISDDAEPAVNIHLVQGLPKGDKMDLIVQKAVEIGVHSIYPLQCRRSIPQIKEGAAAKKMQRWELIAREACKQSGRNRLLNIKPPLNISQLLSAMQGRPGVVLYEKERLTGYKGMLQTLIPQCWQRDLFLLVGPEGGWDDSEIQEISKQGIPTASLGTRMLRTETAGLVAAALALYEAGELGMP